MQLPLLLDCCSLLYSLLLHATTSQNAIDAIYIVKRPSQLHCSILQLLYSMDEKKSVARRWKRRVQVQFSLHLQICCTKVDIYIYIYGAISFMLL